jgi:hypothetical protein
MVRHITEIRISSKVVESAESPGMDLKPIFLTRYGGFDILYMILNCAFGREDGGRRTV